MITSYLARPSFLHRIPAGLKLATLAALSLLLLPVDDWRILSAGVGAACLVYAMLGREGLTRLLSLRSLAMFLAVIAIFQVYLAGWPSALTAVARIALMVMLADLVTLSTTMQDMMDALTPLLRPLRYIGLDPRALTLAVALVVRFVPLLMENWNKRADAYRARCGKRPSLKLVAPFIADTLRLADRVADAIAARGFESSSPTTTKGT